MAIDKIEKKLSNIPLLRKRSTVNPTIQADKDDFMDKYETTNDHLSNKTVGELNQIVDEVNIITEQIDETVTIINTQTETVITKANEASESALSASESASQALASRNQAETFKNQASESALSASESADIVASNKTNIDIIGANITDINIVATNITDIETVVTNLSNIDIVATNIVDINTISDNITDINNVSTNMTDINTIITNLPKVDTVATNITEVVTVSDNIADINTVNTNISDVIVVSEAIQAGTMGTEINDNSISTATVWSSSKVNAELSSLDVSPLNKPVITSPTNGAVDFNESITSTYSTSDYYEGLQSKVIWECALDATFNDIIDSYEGSDNLTSWTPNIGLPLIQVFIRTKQISDGHISKFSDTISFTTPNIFVQTPTITVDGAPSDVKKNPKITLSAFSVFNGTDTQEASDYQVVRVSDGEIVWESLNNTTDLLSITTGDLEVSIQYKFRARQKGQVYGYSSWVETVATTATVFTPTIGIQGTKGFGVAPTDQPFALLGLAEMTGTNEVGHDNYGNYIHTNGSIVCWCPKSYYRVGHPDSPRFATYGENALDFEGTDVFATEAVANAAGYVLPRVFINAGKEQPGAFVDKYMNSKDGNTASKSVFGGVPISLTVQTGYTVSNGMTGCTGILADAVVLSRARGERWNVATAFMYAYLALVSVAQAQAATSTDDVAWYDPTGVTNFPKGCNNNALSDVNDTSVVYASAGDSGNANKPKTGATVGFAKTTHNGSANGVADLNGGMWEVTIGITNFGSSATASTAIATDQIYVLKQSVDVATLTGGWNTANDVWGDATNLATKYDLVTSPHPLGSSTGNVYWGNGANAVFQNDLNGVNRDICGFIPKNSISTGATGANLFGNDQLYKQNIQNMVPLACGAWSNSAGAGVFSRLFSAYRSASSGSYGFRASAYFA